MTEIQVTKWSGANLDIDLTSSTGQIDWEQDKCPWNRDEHSEVHRCAVKNTSICPYFRGVEYLDIVLCSYPYDNPHGREIEIDEKLDVRGPVYGKSEVCEPIIRSLPEWFGIEEANRSYLEDIDIMPTFLAFSGSAAVGFLTLNEHTPYAAEVHIMAVLPEYHRRGFGSRILCGAQDYLRSRGIEYLQVKTLSAAHPDMNYEKTRAFYYSMGFRTLEEFPMLWGEANPCNQMIKMV